MANNNTDARPHSKELLEAARLITIGRYSETDAHFDRGVYDSQGMLPFLVVFGFVHRFALRQHKLSGGDHLMMLIVSEIWLYNVTRQIVNGAGLDESVSRENKQRFKKCNSFSIAQYLGVSHATCRRKVLKLIEMGWVEERERRQLSITQACIDAFQPEANLETMADFVSTARTLFRSLKMGVEL